MLLAQSGGGTNEWAKARIGPSGLEHWRGGTPAATSSPEAPARGASMAACRGIGYARTRLRIDLLLGGAFHQAQIIEHAHDVGQVRRQAVHKRPAKSERQAGRPGLEADAEDAVGTVRRLSLTQADRTLQ